MSRAPPLRTAEFRGRACVQGEPCGGEAGACQARGRGGGGAASGQAAQPARVRRVGRRVGRARASGGRRGRGAPLWAAAGAPASAGGGGGAATAVG
eukprot:5444137-Prymnesium_polylepis.1